MIVGSKVAIMAIIIATCWVGATVEIRRPILNAVIIYRIDSRSSIIRLPVKGILKIKTPIARMSVPSMKARRM
jgi:hypothetical protein